MMNDPKYANYILQKALHGFAVCFCQNIRIKQYASNAICVTSR